MKIRPKKSLGQNFLINAGLLEKIASAAELKNNDTVLEIGPGTGNLTKLLSEKSGRVIAIEKDRRLIEELQKKFKNTNIEIIEADVLQWTPSQLQKCLLQYKIVANLPYYITSHFLRMVFERWPKPKLIVLTVQKEVAQRIVAKPPDMNLLALSVQLYAEPKIIGHVSRGSFRPMPNVDSAIIKMITYDKPLTTDPVRFFTLVKAGFSEKRKQLISNLSRNFGIMKEDILKVFEKIGIKQDIRAENLSLSQWIELSKFIEK